MIVWSEQLKKDYVKASYEFCEIIIPEARNNFKKADTQALIIIKQRYLDFFEKTLEILQAFFIYNKLQYLEDKWIVITVLKSKVLKNGMPFYDLYNYFITIKNNSEIGIDEKYLEDKYLNSFREIRRFLEMR